MKHSFSLGIQDMPENLSTMVQPGCYWLMFDRSLDADLFCQQVIKALPEGASAALITDEHTPENVLATVQGVRIKKLSLFSLPEKKAALCLLTRDLSRAIFKKNCFYILSINSSLWHEFSEADLEEWLQNTATWLINENSTLLIITYGPGAETLNQRLSKQHRAIDGLGQFNWQLDRLDYEISWWSTLHSLAIRQVHSFYYDHQGLKIIEAENQTIYPDIHNDAFIYLVEKHVLEDKPTWSEHWHVFDDNETLVKKAQDARFATLIFAIFKGSEVDTLARQIHATRQHCGKALKIIVRELFDGLRNADVRLLLACGANLIVPDCVPLAKFITLLDAVNGQIYTRHLPDDIDALLESMHPIKHQGYLIAEEFKVLIKVRLDNSMIPQNEKGILIVLEPKPGLDALQALSICDLLRAGDIATVSKNRLVLFLSTCNLGDVDTALQFIFRMPIKEIFSQYQIYNQDLDILKAIKPLKNEDQQLPAALIKPDSRKEKTRETPTIKHRLLPTAITLMQKPGQKKGSE